MLSRSDTAGSVGAGIRLRVELIAIFKEATRLEIEFWEMGWRAGQLVNRH
jgi:hypothetical protein